MSMKKYAVLFIGTVFSLMLAVCVSCGGGGDDDEESAGDYDSVDEELWDAGNDPDGDNGGYAGYGDLNGGGVDCSNDPCVYGKCVTSNGIGQCVCNEGYDGKYCQTCADGYEPDGLKCVLITPCSDFECFYGICKVEDGAAVCRCDSGYKGTHCDECADNYHEEDGECLPD